jgi:hypothetical protein
MTSLPRLRPQRRGRRISLSDAERDAFLEEQATARVATAGLSGPHVAPMWFVWAQSSIWLYSLLRSQRWADIERDARVAIVADAGEDYSDLRGVEISGVATLVGEVPRVGLPNLELEAIERSFEAKYGGDVAGTMVHDQQHAWLRVEPTEIASWDFRKI